ncbi:hypothetical protein N9854_06020 [Amylibacter sp.]|nr:hypothetical protein [Amylibacter sp.]
MKELILHVGYSKCASSSLQRFLCQNPKLNTNQNEVYQYWIINNKNNLISGDNIKRKITKSYDFYSSHISIHNPVSLHKALENLKKECPNDESVILSCEALTEDETGFEKIATIFENLQLPIRIFFLVRPQVEWVNSSWWQWGCWLENMNPDQWFLNYRKGKMLDAIKKWDRLENVQECFVADISQDPINSFLEFLKIEKSFPQIPAKINSGSSPDLLRLLINNKDLFQRTCNDSRIEDELNHFLGSKSFETPFFLSQGQVEEITTLNAKDHEILLTNFTHPKKKIPPLSFQRHISAKQFLKKICNFDYNNFLNEDYDQKFLLKIIQYNFDRFSKKFDAKKYLRFSKKFDAEKYLRLNTDVLSSGMNPYEHFMKHGIEEGRNF